MSDLWDVWGGKRLAFKGIGVVVAVITSHAITLLGDPKFADFWTSWGLSPLQIVNKTAFQSKLTFALTAVAITAEHFYQRWTEKKPAVQKS